MTMAPLEINVIYDASATRGQRGAVVTRTGPPSSRWFIVGLVNLILAGGLYYGAWWRVDREVLYPNLIMHSTIPGVDLNLLESKLFPQKKSANRKTPTKTQKTKPEKNPPGQKKKSASQPARTAPAKTKPPTVDADTIQLWGAAYTWLALATLASCALALSSGSLIGRTLGDSSRRVGKILAGGTILGLGLAGYIVLSKHGMEFPPSALRLMMGGLGGLFFFAGLTIVGRVRGLAHLAAVTLILSAIGSVVGLLLWSRLGAIPAEQVTVTFLVIVFLIHSGWAWALWPIASRLPR